MCIHTEVDVYIHTLVNSRIYLYITPNTETVNLPYL